MRLLAPSVILALALLGGVALAQPALVQDPWATADGDASAWFTASPEKPAAQLPVEAVLYDPWVRASAPNAVPTVPLAAAPAARVDPIVTSRSVASFDEEESLVVDPWANDRNAPERGSVERHGAWAGRVVEIVDPWQRTPDRPTNDSVSLVRDPWAR